MKSRREFDSEEEYKEYLRKYFAATAMRGILSGRTDSGYWIKNHNQLAKESIEIADELLTQFNKQTK